MTTASKYIDGVPKFPQRDSVLEASSTCIQAKQTKNATTGITLEATVPFQGFSIDFNFAGIRLKNAKRRRDYLGVHGETCWLLITDHFSKYIWGKTFKSKVVPLQYLRDWLDSNCSTHENTYYVCLDQGGEMYSSTKVRKLFQRYGFTICPTSSDSSHQLGPVERTHLIVTNSVRAQLIGANIDIRFWPYCFNHTLCLLNVNSCEGMDYSRVEAFYGRCDNFKNLKYFGS